MKKFILDYSKWRCGLRGENKVGEGHTRLLNEEGFMCCLGQFSLQSGAKEENIIGVGYPSMTSLLLNGLTTTDHGIIKNSAFSNLAIPINDNEFTTPEEKIKRLTTLCKEHGYELEVINQPA